MIQLSVGKGRRNKAVDVVVLQLLFNQICIYETTDANGKRQCSLSSEGNNPALTNLKVDGTSTAELAKRIEDYQRAKKMKVIDGWLGPNGATMRAILSDAGLSAAADRMAFIRTQIPSNDLNTLKVEPFLLLYGNQYGQQTSDDKEGLRYIAKTAKADKDVTSLNEFAYMLATTKHETAHTFRAIGEYGKGAGRAYGSEISVTDPTTKKVYKNKYYGRGYVQLTWGYNYQRIDHQLGYGVFPNRNKTKASDYNKGFTISAPTKSIYLNPENALNKEVAYVGLVWGMQKGIYTARKISQYVNSSKTDYVNARRVINGTDKASSIAAYAENLEILLRLAGRIQA